MEKCKVWIPNKTPMSTVLVPVAIYRSYLARANTEIVQERLKVEEIGDDTHGTNLKKTVKSPRQNYSLKKDANQQPSKTSRDRVRKHRLRKRTEEQINRAVLQYRNELDQNKPTNETLQQMKGLLNVALELEFLEDACIKLQNVIDSAPQPSTRNGMMKCNIAEIKPDPEDQLQHVPKTVAERSKKYREKQKKRKPNLDGDKVIGTTIKPAAKTVAERVRKHREKMKYLKPKPDVVIRPKAKTPTERVRDYRARKKINDLLNKALENTVDDKNTKQEAISHITPTTIVKEEILLDDTKLCEENGLELKNYPFSGNEIMDINDPPTNISFSLKDQSDVKSFLYGPDHDDYEIFGTFVANELKGLANNTSIVETVKAKIHQAISEGYERYKLNIQQEPPLPPSAHVCLQIKSELMDEDPE